MEERDMKRPRCRNGILWRGMMGGGGLRRPFPAIKFA
jgi:hypothetical protein